MKTNNCKIIGILAVCNGDVKNCLFFHPGAGKSCVCHKDGRCSHAKAVSNSVKESEEKHLKMGA